MADANPAGAAPSFSTAASSVRHGGRHTTVLILLVAALAFFFAPGFIEHARLGLSHTAIADDARQQTWPLMCHAGESQFCDDYIGRFYLSSYPIGYHGLYYVFGKTGLADPLVVGSVLPYVLFAVVLGALCWAVGRTEGWLMALATAILLCSGDDFTARMTGGLARSFAFPTAAIAVGGLLLGRTSWLMVATIFGAATYFALGVFAGCCLALHLLLPQGAWHQAGSALPWRRKLVLLGITGVVAGLLVVPVAVTSKPFGPPTTRAALSRFPEIGPGGRYSWEDALEARGLPADALTSVLRATTNLSRPLGLPSRALGDRLGALIKPALLLLVVAGLVVAVPSRPHLQRVLLAVPVVAVLYYISDALWPQFWIPQRYVGYTVPLLTVVLTPIAVGTLVSRAAGLVRLGVTPGLCGLVAAAGLTLLLGGRGPGESGLSVRHGPEEARLLSFLSTLPREALVAGWPGDDEAFESTGVIARRRMLVSFETHQVYHQQYATTLRARMNALVDAYAAGRADALAQLRDRFGVTHLVVDWRHFDRPLKTFEPFTARVRALATSEPAAAKALAGATSGAEVFRSEHFSVVALAQIGRGASK
jgi:hypothetical protein